MVRFLLRVVLVVAGTALTTVMVGGALGLFIDDDIRYVSGWLMSLDLRLIGRFLFENVVAPIAQFTNTLRGTWVHDAALVFAILGAGHFFLKWRSKEEKHLEKLEEKSELGT
jgi:hypothetical protein